MVKKFPKHLLKRIISRINKDFGNYNDIDKFKIITLMMYSYNSNIRVCDDELKYREIHIMYMNAHNGGIAPIVITLSGTPPKGIWLIPYYAKPLCALFYSEVMNEVWNLCEHDSYYHEEVMNILDSIINLLLYRDDITKHS